MALGRSLKRTVFSLAERSIFASWFGNLAAHTVETVSFLRSHYRDTKLNYVESANVIGTLPGHLRFNDPALNFFTRIILSRDYDFVIEIGAYSLERSRELARLFPKIEFYALDVGMDYLRKGTIDRVHIAPNSIANITAIGDRHRKGLLCSHGTLAYYNADCLERLIKTCKKLTLDIALVEPNAMGECSRTTSLKRSRMSWFHPYIHLLTTHGYSLPDGNGHQIGNSFSASSEWQTLIFATIDHP